MSVAYGYGSSFVSFFPSSLFFSSSMYLHVPFIPLPLPFLSFLNLSSTLFLASLLPSPLFSSFFPPFCLLLSHLSSVETGPRFGSIWLQIKRRWFADLSGH